LKVVRMSDANCCSVALSPAVTTGEAVGCAELDGAACGLPWLLHAVRTSAATASVAAANLADAIPAP
jgi:hypothetical protein